METTTEELNCLREASPANRSARLASSKAQRMTATSGRKCAELLHKQDPLGLWLKTCLASLEWRSMMCSLTWKPKATPRGRLLFQLAALEQTTGATGFGLLPTPRANRYGFADSHGKTPIRGTPNPEWREWQMGYPTGWTETRR